jgi:hypothetical protein
MIKNQGRADFLMPSMTGTGLCVLPDGLLTVRTLMSVSRSQSIVGLSFRPQNKKPIPDAIPIAIPMPTFWNSGCATLPFHLGFPAP